MLGDFITRIIILLVVYAYPAYGCYKSVEKKKPEIHELRYWCKYWILLGLFTVFERIGDIVVSWLPLYREIKIALLIYLWYPKSQGISYVYEMLLCPYMSKHESDIDKGISVLKSRGHFIIVQLLQCVYQWTLQIFRQVQQQFSIDKKGATTLTTIPITGDLAIGSPELESTESNRSCICDMIFRLITDNLTQEHEWIEKSNQTYVSEIESQRRSEAINGGKIENQRNHHRTKLKPLVEDKTKQLA